MSSRALLRGFSCLAMAALGACSGSTGPAPARYEVEVQTVEEQALEEVLAAPTDFTVASVEADAAWARAALFFDRYTSTGGVFTSTREAEVLASRGGPASYRYEVVRAPAGAAYRFQVRCSPRGGAPSLAERNARNLARFIRDGNLELSLLAQ